MRDPRKKPIKLSPWMGKGLRKKALTKNKK